MPITLCCRQVQVNARYHALTIVYSTICADKLDSILCQSLPMFEITEQGVYNLLSDYSFKPPGPDTIHQYVLKIAAARISPTVVY